MRASDAIHLINSIWDKEEKLRTVEGAKSLNYNYEQFVEELETLDGLYIRDVHVRRNVLLVAYPEFAAKYEKLKVMG